MTIEKSQEFEQYYHDTEHSNRKRSHSYKEHYRIIKIFMPPIKQMARQATL